MYNKKLNVLVLCEESQVITESMLQAGHTCHSLDIQACSGPYPDKHIKMDAMLWLATCNEYYDLIIGHPPCTALSVSGNRWYAKGKDRYSERLKSAIWTDNLWNLCKNKSRSICFENPVGVIPKLCNIEVKPQYIQPYQFGHMETKKTGLWLYNLPPLKETNNVYDSMMLLPKKERNRIHFMSPGKERGKERSKTYTGIASAMVDQWTQ